jgi:hypothetical protein
MTTFELGFRKYAQECGLSKEQTAHILKRAADHPAVEEMFKQLPTETQEAKPEDMDNLSDLVNQDKIDQQMKQASRLLADILCV